jgi:hypothetical protein
LKTQLDLH